MNYTFSVSCLCVLYSLSLVSSQRDLPTDEQNTNSPRLRALTPYAQPGIRQDHEGANITADSDSDGEFCVVTSQKRPSITSENARPAYPESPAQSPVTLNTRLGHRRVLSHSDSGLEKSDMPSSPRHRLSPEIAPNTPESQGTLFGTLQEQRERDGLPVTTSIEHSNAVKKEATTPTSDTFSQIPLSAISTFAATIASTGTTASVLTQRRNSRSPKTLQQEQVLNVRTIVPTTTPNSSAAVASAASRRYQLNETMADSHTLQACANQNHPLTTGQQLFGADFIVSPLDPEEKTGSGQHVITIESTLKPRPANPSCFEVLCCCCLFKKTKKR